MRIAVIALTAAGMAGAWMLAVEPATAEPQQLAQAATTREDAMTAPAARSSQNSRARVTVKRRSFLDPGPEYLPNSRQNMVDRAMPYGYSAVETALGPTYGWDRRPFNDPWDTAR